MRKLALKRYTTYLDAAGGLISTSICLDPELKNRPENKTAMIIATIAIKAIAHTAAPGPPEPLSSAIFKSLP
jgi:hypothetical protein